MAGRCCTGMPKNAPLAALEFNLADLFEATVDAVSEREALVAGE